MAEELQIVGKRAPNLDAYDRVTGGAKYTGDIELPGMLVARVLRSPHPHARIVSIDTSKAAALPGVRAVRLGPDRVALTVAEVHRAVPALLALLERRGAELSLLATHHATLEDVFVALTGRQLRDA